MDSEFRFRAPAPALTMGPHGGSLGPLDPHRRRVSDPETSFHACGGRPWNSFPVTRLLLFSFLAVCKSLTGKEFRVSGPTRHGSERVDWGGERPPGTPTLESTRSEPMAGPRGYLSCQPVSRVFSFMCPLSRLTADQERPLGRG